MGRGKRIEGMLNELPEPGDSEVVVKVTNTPGGNLVQVADAQGQGFLCRIPAKFRGNVWVKKGGYLIVERGEEEPGQQGEAVDKSEESTSKQQHGTLKHFLYRDQIRNLQSRGLWPFDSDGGPSAEYGETDYGSELHANVNRAHQKDVSDSSEEESSEDDDA